MVPAPEGTRGDRPSPKTCTRPMSSRITFASFPFQAVPLRRHRTPDRFVPWPCFPGQVLP